MHARLLARAELDRVVDALRDVAGQQLDDGLADADGNDFRIRSAAEEFVELILTVGEREQVSGEDAERAGAVSGISSGNIGIARVIGGLIVDEVALEIGLEQAGERRVVLVVSGIEVRDADRRALSGIVARLAQLRLIVLELPREFRRVWQLIALVLEVAGRGGAQPRILAAGRPRLNEVGLDQHGLAALERDTAGRIQRVGELPRIRRVGGGHRPRDVPGVVDGSLLDSGAFSGADRTGSHIEEGFELESRAECAHASSTGAQADVGASRQAYKESSCFRRCHGDCYRLPPLPDFSTFARFLFRLSSWPWRWLFRGLRGSDSCHRLEFVRFPQPIRERCFDLVAMRDPDDVRDLHLSISVRRA